MSYDTPENLNNDGGLPDHNEVVASRVLLASIGSFVVSRVAEVAHDGLLARDALAYAAGGIIISAMVMAVDKGWKLLEPAVEKSIARLQNKNDNHQSND